MKTIIETLREIRIRPTLMWAPPVTTGDIATSRDGRRYAVAVDGSLRTGRVRPRNGKKARRERIAMRRLDREYGWTAAAPQAA
jgi:hypothetical protein